MRILRFANVLSREGLALLVSLSLLWTSGPTAEAVSAVVSPTPVSLAKWLSPAPRLGHIVDFNQAAGGKKGGTEGRQRLVILIQDLHAHYGVQKNIAGLLEFL